MWLKLKVSSKKSEESKLFDGFYAIFVEISNVIKGTIIQRTTKQLATQLNFLIERSEAFLE